MAFLLALKELDNTLLLDRAVPVALHLRGVLHVGN